MKNITIDTISMFTIFVIMKTVVIASAPQTETMSPIGDKLAHGQSSMESSTLVEQLNSGIITTPVATSESVKTWTSKASDSTGTSEWTKSLTTVGNSDSIMDRTTFDASDSIMERKTVDASESTIERKKIDASDSTMKRTTFHALDSADSDSMKKRSIVDTWNSTKKQTTFEASDSTRDWANVTASDSTMERTTMDTPISTMERMTVDASDSTMERMTVDASDSTMERMTVDASDPTMERMTVDASDPTMERMTVDESDHTMGRTTMTASDSTKEWITARTRATDDPDYTRNASHQSTTPTEPLTFTELEPVNQLYNATADASTMDSSIIIPVISFSVGSVVMMINILVMVASAKNHELRQNTNYNLVMGLSLSDFLLGLSMFLVGLRLHFPVLIQNLGLCIATNISPVTSLCMSYLQTFYISLHRYLVISESVRGQRFFDKGKYYLYIIGWTIVIALFSSFISPDVNQSKCFTVTVFSTNTQYVRQILFAFVLILLLLTVLFYSLAIYQLSRRTLSVSRVSDAGEMMDRKRHKRLIRSMKLVTMILATLFLFSGPLVIVLGLVYDKVTHSIFLVTVVAANFNSFLNPIIYCSHITQLRTELKSMFTCTTKQ
jgi:hypothetical protein